MTINIVRDIPKTFLERALCYYFFPKSITSTEYHLLILVKNINIDNLAFFQFSI